MSILQLWGKELQNYRKNAGFTQGQLIDQLSLLVNDLSEHAQQALEDIGVYEEATTYFGGILDAPTLSRLEKGTRSLKSRQRCVALVWGLVQLGAMPTVEEANRFLELGGHGNLTSAEANAIFASDQPVANEAGANVEAKAQLGEHRSDVAPDIEKPKEEQARIGGQRNRWVAAGAIGLLIAALGIGYLFSQRATLDPPASPTDNVVDVAADNPTDDAPDTAVDAAQVTATANPIARPDERTVHTLLAESLTTQFGEIGKDQTFVNLHELDQTGNMDIWLQHVKFVPVDAPYRGYRSYFVPAYLYMSQTPPAVAAIQIETNYRGRGIDGQVWTWRLFNWIEQGWVTVGDNGRAHWWGDWQMLTFDASGTLADYINPDTGEIRLEVQANDMSDTMDLDYEAIIVTVDQRADAESARAQRGLLEARLVDDFIDSEIDSGKWLQQNAPSVTVESGHLMWKTPINDSNEWASESLEYIGVLDKISRVNFEVSIAPAALDTDSDVNTVGALGVSTGCVNDAGWMTVFAGNDPPTIFVEFASDDQTEDGERFDIMSIEDGKAYVVDLLWVDDNVQISVKGADSSYVKTVPCNATTYFNLSTSSAIGETVNGSIGHIYVWE